MNRTISRLGFTALTLIAGSVALVAQDATTGAVFGTITDSGSKAPIAGARILIDGGRGQQAFTSDASGKFTASSLIPGKYAVTVTAPGYDQPYRGSVSVGVNQRTPFAISLSKGAVVVVTASSATIDTTQQTSGSTFNSEQFSSLPLGRSFTSVVSLAPGVVDGGGTGAANPSISGGSGLENQYVIDGANTTNAGFGANGAFSIAYGSLGNGINTEFIQEVQVKSFGMDAEYGQATGGVINAITKSGDNTFRGTVFAYGDFDGLQSKDKVPVFAPGTTPQPTFDSSSRTEIGFSVSGPIIKDKLFYFVGYNPIQSTVTRTAPAGYALAGRKFDQKSETNSYYVKLNWALNSSHSFELSVFGDPGKRPLGPQAASDYRGAEGRFSELKFGTDTYSVKYNGILGNDFFLEARISNSKNEFKRIPGPAANGEWLVSDTATGAALSPNGFGFYEKKQAGENMQYEIKLTKILGPVELKAGYLYEDITWDGENGRTGPVGFVDLHNGAVFTQGLSISKRYRATNIAGPFNAANITPYYRITRGDTSNPSLHTKTTYSALFLQANIQVSNHFNAKLGLRMEEQELKGTQLTYKFKGSDNLAPRLSLTWDVDGNGKSKAYFFAGRYFEKIPNDIAVRALSTEQGINRSDWNNLIGFSNLTSPILTGTPIQDVNAVTGAAIGAPVTNHFAVTGSSPTVIFPNTKSQFQDELVLGYDIEPSPGLSLSTRGVYHKLGRLIEDISYDADSYQIGNPGQNVPSIPGATFPTPTRNYYAAEFELKKTAQHYNGFVNVRISKSEGNYEGLFRNDNGQSDPNISSLYDLPVELMADPARGLTGMEQFLIGALPTDRTLVMNAGGSYLWDNGLSTGAVARYQTGTPITSYLAHPVYENAGEVPLYGRGVEGRLPSTFSIDWNLMYTMKVGKTSTLAFRTDIFNLFNAHEITSKDTNLDLGLNAPNPNYMYVTGYQTARRIRLGVSFKF